MRRSVSLSLVLALLACSACAKSSTSPNGNGPTLIWDKVAYDLTFPATGATGTITTTALLRVTPGTDPLPATIGVNLTGYKVALLTDSDHGTGTATFTVQFVASPNAAQGSFNETATLTIGTSTYKASTTVVVD